MKRLYVLIIAILLLIPFSGFCYASTSSTISEPLEGTTADGVKWRYNDESRSEIWIMGCDRDILAETITIPDTMTIWSAVHQRFITTPVTKILYDSIFSNCTQIKQVEIYSTMLTEIPYGTFENCTELTKVILPENLLKIGGCAFDGCTKLNSINLPEGLTEIGHYALRYTALTSITIPKSLTQYGYAAFAGCDLLSHVTWNAVNATCSGYNNVLFNGCITTPGSTVIFGEEVESIPESLFSGCTGLTNVTFPESLTSIGERAFFGCEALTEITIPNSLTTVEDSAFRYCYVLNTVNYNGNQESWERINIVGYDNGIFKNAQRNYFWYVTYLDEDGANIQRDKASDNATITSPDIPVEDGYILKFYTDKNLTTEFDISTPITENTSLYVAKKPVALTAEMEKTSVGYVFNVTLNKEAIKSYENALLIAALYEGDKFVCMAMLPVTSIDISLPITVETKETATIAKLMLWDGFDTLTPLCDDTQTTIS